MGYWICQSEMKMLMTMRCSQNGGSLTWKIPNFKVGIGIGVGLPTVVDLVSVEVVSVPALTCTSNYAYCSRNTHPPSPSAATVHRNIVSRLKNFDSWMKKSVCCMLYYEVRSGQVWGHTSEQRVVAFTLRQYFFGVRLAITQADARPAMPISLI